MSEQTPINVPVPSLPGQPEKKSKKGLIIAIIAIVIVLVAGAAYYFLVYSKDDKGDNPNKAVIVNNVNSEVNVNVINTNTQNANEAAVNVNTNLSADNVNSMTTNVNVNSVFGLNSNFTGEQEAFLLDLYADADADDIPDRYERIYGTDINKKDSDADGYNDGTEIKACFNPTADGEMDGEYYTEIYCPNYAREVFNLITVVYSDMSQEEEDALLNTYYDLCEDWGEFADELFKGGEHDTLYKTSNLTFKSSCDKTTERYNSGELTEMISIIEYIATTAEEFCFEFSSGIKNICGEAAGFWYL
jgi:hypothetical protein